MPSPRLSPASHTAHLFSSTTFSCFDDYRNEPVSLNCIQLLVLGEWQPQTKLSGNICGIMKVTFQSNCLLYMNNYIHMHSWDTKNHTMPTFEFIFPNQNHEAISALLSCVSEFWTWDLVSWDLASPHIKHVDGPQLPRKGVTFWVRSDPTEGIHCWKPGLG